MGSTLVWRGEIARIDRAGYGEGVTSTAGDLTAIDAAHVWHPYGAFPPTTTPLVVASAQGTRLTLADGRELVDGMSSWWAVIHGYRHPVLDAALAAQAAKMSHVMFGGLTHAPAVRLCELLVAHHAGRSGQGVPRGLRVGVGRGRGEDVPAVLAQPRPPGTQTAADLARRLSRRHLHRDERVRPRGRHALAVDRHPGRAGVRAASRRPTTTPPTSTSSPTRSAEHAHELAAVIVEPVVQGAGGMSLPRPALPRRPAPTLRRARRAADLRRDRHRLRPHRRTVRRRPRRRRPGHHVRRQGDHRWLHHAGRDAVHRAHRARRSAPSPAG